MTTFEYHPVDGLSVELRDRILWLALDRPQRRNAIDDVMMAGLIGAVGQAGRDEGVGAIHLSGRGDHFCGGADIVARNSGDQGRPRVGSIQRRLPSQAHRLLPLLCSTQVPVITAVTGWAVGIGFQLALASDFTIVAEDSRFWEPFTSRGFTPDSGATWLLPRVVGPARARELLLLGRELTGVEAASWGVAHRAVAAADVQQVSTDLATKLAAGPTVSLGLTKWLLAAGQSASLEEHLANEAFALELSSRSEDFREGLAAFTERREPDFKGR